MSGIARYSIASFVAAFVLFAGLGLAGAGHGWMSGALGCLALAPIAFIACANALKGRPSRRIAMANMTLGLAACVAVGVATKIEGAQTFFRHWPTDAIIIGGFAYLNWLLMSALAISRSQRAP